MTSLLYKKYITQLFELILLYLIPFVNHKLKKCAALYLKNLPDNP